jgi:DNA mismatch repair protein MSH6
MDDFIAPDDSDEDAVVPTKRKRQQSTRASKAGSPRSSPPVATAEGEGGGAGDEDEDIVMTGTSTAQQWTYDPDNLEPLNPRPTAQSVKKDAKMDVHKKIKARPSASEPDQRYPWLANILDADRHPPDHPQYNPSTIYIPPLAWAKFSPFEKQYWEIKAKFWDSIVFFKKGKFYELYENDATVGHQLFDLKLTDRVNMRMVGVPEASLELWASQFLAKGYRVARVDQMESALAKQMRERDDKKPAKKSKDDKVIKRELASVLTTATLVDANMLQSDMATYCMAIKEIDRDNLPAFGIAFVDCATAQFQLCEFTDDIDLTKFETLIAQMRPGELVLEKSCLSAKAMRILKNSTSPTTRWNYLKPNKEFWSAEDTVREIGAAKYFQSNTEDDAIWPPVLREACENELALSAFGGLLHYLGTLKIERDLVKLGNFEWYDPIRKATSLVLDGQSLINLEIFANNYDGSTNGTLFSMLNRCITPFGKRLLRQWVCHPLADETKINARLDAVDALNANSDHMDKFTSSLTKLPDLERLISRVHAGRCKPQDFIKVLEGFEQIEYTMNTHFRSAGEGDGLIGQLVASMPDLAAILEEWKTAFDRNLAKAEGILVPVPGVEEDFDESQKAVDECLADLDHLLKKVQKELGTKAVVYRDNGKEIYQLEVPKKIKVPKNWDQMSATAKVTRYYSPELRKLVRSLQEAQETHGQIVREVSGRFYAKFSANYSEWLAAIKIIAQLDCLISLAKASANLGDPACRPNFSTARRTLIEFEDLRHPCMLNAVADFIPNDIKLGGDTANIDLLMRLASRPSCEWYVGAFGIIAALLTILIDLYRRHSRTNRMLSPLQISNTHAHRPYHVPSRRERQHLRSPINLFRRVI